MGYYIYKHLNSDMEVIYVGQSKNIKNRTNEHKSTSSWNKEIYKIVYAEVSDKMLMNLYEKYYISKHLPKYNTKDTKCEYSRFFTSLEELHFEEYIEILKPIKEKHIKTKNIKNKKTFSESFEEYYKNSIKMLNDFKNEFNNTGRVVNGFAYIDNYIDCNFIIRSSVGISASNKIRTRCFETNTYGYDTCSNTLNIDKYNHLKSEEQLKYKSLDEMWEEIFK